MSFGDDIRRRRDQSQSASPSRVMENHLYSNGESSSSTGLRSLESGSSSGSMKQHQLEERASYAGANTGLLFGQQMNRPQQQSHESTSKISPVFDCVNPSSTTPLSSRSSEGESSYFRAQNLARPPILVSIDKQLPSLPPDEPDEYESALNAEQMDDSFDSRITTQSKKFTRTPDIRYPEGRERDRSAEHAHLTGNESTGSRSRLSPSWNAAKNAFGMTSKGRNRSSPGSTSPTRSDEKDLIGLGVRAGEPHDVQQAQHSWSNTAGAMKAAGQSAGSGLKKWGKVSAAKLKQAQQLGKDGSPLLTGWAKGSGGGLKRYDGRAAKSAAELTTSSDADFVSSPMPMLPMAMPDPRIGLPTDVRHNVHVDVGPQGYTGLPVSWAQVLAQHGMNAEDVRRDPYSAVEVIKKQTQYFVDKEAERGHDPEQTKRVLESRLGQLGDMEEAREAVRSATPAPSKSRHSMDNATRSDATLKRGSNASTTYSSVLNQGWPASPTWSDAPSLPRLKTLDNGHSPILPNVSQGEDDDDWGASILRALPKSASAISGLVDRPRSRSFESRSPLVANTAEKDPPRQDKETIDDHADDQEEMAEDMEMASIHTASKISAIKITRSSISSSSLSHDAAAALRLVDRRESAGSFSLRHNDLSEARSSSVASRSASPSNDDFGARSVPSSATAASSASHSQTAGLSAMPGSVRPPSTSSSAASDLGVSVVNGLRERRKHSPRIYPPSSSKFVGGQDAPSPRSIGFKPTSSISGTANHAVANRQSTASTQLSDTSLSVDRTCSDGNTHLDRSRGTTPDLGQKGLLQDQFRNSGASVRLASTPLQSYLRTTPNDESESKNSLQAAREPVSSTGQGTPDLIMPDADGFFRPSNTSTSSPTTHSPSSERAAIHNETHAMAQSRGNGAIANWQRSYDGNNVDFAKARPESRSQVSEAAEDYEPTSDFLDDWLNGEGEEDEEDDDESLAPTVSSKSKERKRSTKRVPAPLKSSEASSHQSPSPALLLGLPTPLRAQFQASLAKSANTSSPTSSGPPSALVPHVAISSIVHRAGPTSQQDESLLRAQRDWRARSLPPPPQEEVALETEMTADTGPTTDNNHPIVRKEKPEMLGNSQDTTHDDEKNIVTRASSRASRASSRTGRRSLGRRSSDARRFPVSMHYASGFDTDTLTTNPEAMNSFAELMRSRQSMDLDDVMPLSMTEADGTVPPVPTLSHAAGGVEDSAVSRELPEEVNRYSVEALPSQLRALQPLLRTEEPKKIFGDLILIGEGESGNVYSTIPTSQCVVPSLKGRGKVAIKVINLGTGPEEGEEQKKARQIRLAILHQEMTLWRDGGKQSNILGLYDIFLSTGRPNQPDSVYVVQEFMSISLADIIALRDAGLVIEETHIARITKDLCLALKHLHACTIIHRDVRSDNVLLNFDGKAKLSDFTHATSVAASKRTSTVGTAYWMAPEVINAVPYDTQADMWSLGAVLFEMAVGEPPRVELPSLRAIALTTSLGMPPLSEPQRWSNAFRNCLSWCTQMSADERATAEQLLQDPFVASAHSYDALADLVEQARFIEVDALYDHDDEEFVVEERSPSMLQAAPPNTHMRDSWTSQSTVHA